MYNCKGFVVDLVVATKGWLMEILILGSLPVDMCGCKICNFALLLDECLRGERLVRPKLLLEHKFVLAAIGCTFGLAMGPSLALFLKSWIEQYKSL